MNSFKLSFAFSASILFAAACSGANVSQNTANAPTNTAASNMTAAQSPTSADEFAATREIYSKRCINCHQENGEGGAKEFDGKKIKVPNFKDPRVAAESDSEYIEYIENGEDGMPAFKGKITDEEIKNLVRFIRKEFQGK
ncbi:MAG: cytochrome c [Acidobacteriota bacterium]|nr:cytochrome c [Acidobacteriota bacterium]